MPDIELLILDDFSNVMVCPICDEDFWQDSQDDCHKWNKIGKQMSDHCMVCGENIYKWQRNELYKLLKGLTDEKTIKTVDIQQNC